MALKPLNSVGGFSVGENPSNVILANGDITTGNVTLTGNIAAGGVKSDNYYYANGAPLDFQQPAGSNTQIQYNNNGDFGASANFTFNSATNVLSVGGNIQAQNANLGNVATANFVGGTLTTAAQPNITSVGTLTSLSVTGNGSFGNVAGGNLVSANFLTGTLTTAAQPNITSVGTLTSLSVTGNVTGGNLVTTGTTNTGVLLVSGDGTITGNLTVSGNTNFVDVVNLNVQNPIIGIGRGDNNSPLITNDGKDRGEQLWYYVTGTGEKSAFIGFDNSTGKLLGATDVTITNDVVTVVEYGQFVTGGIEAQGDSTFNGNVTISGDLNVSGNIDYTNANVLVVENPIIEMGRGPNGDPLTSNDGKDRGSQMWYYDTAERSAFMGYNNGTGELIAAANVTVSNLEVTVNQYGSFRAGNIFGSSLNTGTGNVTAGNVFGGNLVDANYLSGVITADSASQPNITSVGTLTSLSVTGNVAAGNVSATSGSFTTVGGTLTTAAQPNITSVGTLDSLSVTGNITANNANISNVLNVGILNANSLSVNGISSTNDITINSNSNVTTFYANGFVSFPGATSATGNVSGANLTTTGVVSATGNISGGNITTDGAVAATGNISGGNISTGGTLTVTGNASAGNISTGGVVTATGNVSGGNITTEGQVVATGNVSGEYFIGNGAFLTGIDTSQIQNGTSNIRVFNSGNVTTSVAGTANVLVVTSTGLVTTGTIQSGAITANGNVSANGYINAGNANITDTLFAENVTTEVINASADGNGNITINAAVGNSWIFLKPTGTGAVDVGNARITALAEPVNATDAATKQYVDTVAEGLHIHASANVATTDTLANLSGGTVTYVNGTDGVGATLTLGTALTTIDGVALTNGMRVLIKNEANQAHNGIYTRTSSTVFTRATDYDTAAEIQGGDFLFVTDGTLYNNTGWVQIDAVVAVGTSPIVFEQFSGAGTYTAGQGLTLTGTSFSVNVDNLTTAIVSGNVVVKESAQLTTPNIGAATGTSLTVTANVTANNLSVGNIANIGGTLTAGNLSTAGAVSATGNITGGNVVSDGVVSATGNVSGGNITTVGVVTATGNVTGGNLSTTGTLSVTGNANIGNIGVTGITATGNISAGNLSVPGIASLGNIANITINGGSNGQFIQTDGNGQLSFATISTSSLVNGNSNVVVAANGNVTVSSAGNADILTVTGTGANVAGTLGVTGNANVGNLGAASGVFTANVSANNLAATNEVTANVVTANTVTANTDIAIGNSTITSGTLTTSSITANQAIAQFSVTGVTGVEFLVKGLDSGGKYSVATVHAVTDGTNVDYAIFGGVNIGTSTGTLSVAISSGNIVLQVSPSSSNSTVWTTQYRLI